MLSTPKKQEPSRSTLALSEDITFLLDYRKGCHPANSVNLSGDEQVVFTRFTFMRRIDDMVVLESPISNLIVGAKSSTAISVLPHLANGASAAQLAGQFPGVDLQQAQAFLALLVGAGLLQRRQEEETSDLRMWEFHDLLFHRMTRVSDMEREFATFRFRGTMEPPPLFKPSMSSVQIRLQAPDLDKAATSDPSLTEVLEARTSKRLPGKTALSLEQLSEFMYRTTHVKAIEKQAEFERMRRPYPSGGGVHELEFYIVVNRCTGLEQGVYSYRSDTHCLERLATSEDAAQRVLARCAMACNTQPNLPDVAIIMAAKFPRMFYKYEGIGYRAILLNVGVVMQTMYLIATAMGLSPCANGSGWLRWLEEQDELSWLSEGAIGEFMLSGPSD